MIPNIILEGTDGSGKTTAANILVDRFGYNYRHDGPPPLGVDDGNCLDYYYILYESFPRPLVWDRSIYGELVYGPIFRESSRLSLEQLDDFMTSFRNDGGVSILLCPPFAEIMTNFQNNLLLQREKEKRGDRATQTVKSGILKSFPKLEEIYHGYRDLAHAGLFDEVIDHYPTFGDLVNVISKWMRRTNGLPPVR